MGKLLAAACAAVLAAFLTGSGGREDARSDGRAAYARRGSLGADDFVATNVFPCASAYALHAVEGTELRDRAVNAVTLDFDRLLEMPLRPAAAGFARAFLVYVKVPGDEPRCITFTGAERVLAIEGSELVFGKGESVVSVVEIEEGVYMFDAKSLIGTEE